MFSTRYVYVYTLILSAFAAISLAFFITIFKPLHDSNEAASKKKDILSSIAGELGQDPQLMSNEDVIKLFDEKVEQLVIDAKGNIIKDVSAEDISLATEEKKPLEERRYPLYIFKSKGSSIYLTAVRGNGLWDKIWGTIAIKDDMNTIVGASFGHQAETPGLGAEIKDNANFPKSFIGKEIFKDGEYVSVKVMKGASDPKHQVDAISGATITSVGVSEMMYKGLNSYVAYFNSIKNKG